MSLERELAKEKKRELSLHKSADSLDLTKDDFLDDIKRISTEGTFQISEPWEEYEILNSEDPFITLYLSSELYNAYSDETVVRHNHEIKKFLRMLQNNKSSGIDFKSTYPKLDIDNAFSRLEIAFKKLSTKSERLKSYLEQIEVFKKKGDTELHSLIEALLLDSVLNPDESRFFISKALKWKYSEEEAAGKLFHTIVAKNFVSAKPVEESWSYLMKITFCDWVERGKEFRSPENIDIKAKSSSESKEEVFTTQKDNSSQNVFAYSPEIENIIEEIKGRVDLANVTQVLSELSIKLVDRFNTIQKK